jgi:hypothetical protein
MSEGPGKTKTTRRDVIKLAGAAAIGAAGAAVLGAPHVLAAAVARLWPSSLTRYSSTTPAATPSSATVRMSPSVRSPYRGAAVSCPTAITEWSAI